MIVKDDRLSHHWSERLWVEPSQCPREPLHQDYLTIVCALGRRVIVRDVGTEDCLPAALEEPAEALLFELVFGDHEVALTGL